MEGAQQDQQQNQDGGQNFDNNQSNGIPNHDYSQEHEDQMKSLADTKKRRKDIERDAQLLANRIALLKQEEMKTWKKIEETKKRTNDIQSLKKRNEDKVQKKIFDFQVQSDQQKNMAHNNYMLGKQRHDEKRKIQEAIYLSKREEAKQAKMIRTQNEQKKKQQNFISESENRMKNQIINQQKRLAQMKIDEDRRRKVMSVKKAHDDKVGDEERMRSQKEEEVIQMERLEMELIKKLQNTQAIQKDAYQELEKALSQPSAMIGSYLGVKDMIGGNKMGREGGEGDEKQDEE